ncbi:sulfite exporter TauE/SafE family protein [Novosphingobium sp. FSW06-99]|uniref:sulfite exporter TauE/SafE family protein n=1 Tax=Novosphingobium sp. FSW06-99 TaxID=1739113 RepID=UPI001E404380|nr:sulfite exporter TauE/SafE family protein [Novosphingobium sp. FSW06-99]
MLSLLSGGLVGFTLGLLGGGGSVLAVPLMVYVVGVKNPHVAIGTSALAVASNALAGLAGHARCRNVNWTIGAVFALTGVIGAVAGSSLGKMVDGQRLLFLFALLMVAVAAAMFQSRQHRGIDGVTCHRGNLPRVLGLGLATGCLSGFFGIGGGFLIVPALIAATSMPIYQAIGTSLVAVSAFGLTTAANYAVAGLVDWSLAGTFILGGVGGTVLGSAASRGLSGHKGRLGTLFAAGILLVAIYMLYRSWVAQSP